MRIYREPTHGYFVLAFDKSGGKFNVRIGYTKPQQLGTWKYVSERVAVFTVWIFGLFLQVDWDRQQGGSA